MKSWIALTDFHQNARVYVNMERAVLMRRLVTANAQYTRINFVDNAMGADDGVPVHETPESILLLMESK